MESRANPEKLTLKLNKLGEERFGEGEDDDSFGNSKQVQLKEESDEACFCLKIFTRADCESHRTKAPI